MHNVFPITFFTGTYMSIYKKYEHASRKWLQPLSKKKKKGKKEKKKEEKTRARYLNFEAG